MTGVDTVKLGVRHNPEMVFRLRVVDRRAVLTWISLAS